MEFDRGWKNTFGLETLFLVQLLHLLQIFVYIYIYTKKVWSMWLLHLYLVGPLAFVDLGMTGQADVVHHPVALQHCCWVVQHQHVPQGPWGIVGQVQIDWAASPTQ